MTPVEPATIIFDGVLASITACVISCVIVIPIGFWYFRRRANKICNEGKVLPFIKETGKEEA